MVYEQKVVHSCTLRFSFSNAKLMSLLRSVFKDMLKKLLPLRVTGLRFMFEVKPGQLSQTRILF